MLLSALVIWWDNAHNCTDFFWDFWAFLHYIMRCATTRYIIWYDYRRFTWTNSDPLTNLLNLRTLFSRNESESWTSRTNPVSFCLEPSLVIELLSRTRFLVLTRTESDPWSTPPNTITKVDLNQVRPFNLPEGRLVGTVIWEPDRNWMHMHHLTHSTQLLWIHYLCT